MQEVIAKIFEDRAEKAIEEMMSRMFPDYDPDADRTLHLASCTCSKCQSQSRWKYGQPVITTDTF